MDRNAGKEMMARADRAMRGKQAYDRLFEQLKNASPEEVEWIKQQAYDLQVLYPEQRERFAGLIIEAAEPKKRNKPPKSPGRKPSHGVNEKQQERILKAWKSNQYATLSELRAALNLMGKLSEDTIRKIIDADSKRRKRAILKDRQ